MYEYIDKGKVIARFEEIKKSGVSFRDAVYLDGVMAVLDSFQTEDVAPVVHGKWEPTKYPFMSECVDCSKCGYRTITGHGFNYCPRCGAKMDLQEVSHG